jgi:hypothetical protein
MTLEVRTIHGDSIDVGFWGGDITKIQLGDLAPMTTQQFVGYAAVRLAQDIIPTYDPLTRMEWATAARMVSEDLLITPQIEYTGKFLAQDTDRLASQLYTVPSEDLDELMITLQAAVTPVEDPEYYARNPFEVMDDGVHVSMIGEDARHTITAHDFHALTHHVLRGGMMGWGHSGTYVEVRNAAGLIHDALSK